jgi:hypothetical protein
MHRQSGLYFFWKIAQEANKLWNDLGIALSLLGINDYSHSAGCRYEYSKATAAPGKIRTGSRSLRSN